MISQAVQERWKHGPGNHEKLRKLFDQTSQNKPKYCTKVVEEIVELLSDLFPEEICDGHIKDEAAVYMFAFTPRRKQEDLGQDAFLNVQKRSGYFILMPI